MGVGNEVGQEIMDEGCWNYELIWGGGGGGGGGGGLSWKELIVGGV